MQTVYVLANSADPDEISCSLGGISSGFSLVTKVLFSCIQRDSSCASRYRVKDYKTFSMLNSAEHKIYPAHKCLNANNCWHFNIY